MHQGIDDFLKNQLEERKVLTGFKSDPKDLKMAIFELVVRFENISPSQVMLLLKPWFPQYVVGPEICSLIFFKKLIESRDCSLSLSEETL